MFLSAQTCVMNSTIRCPVTNRLHPPENADDISGRGSWTQLMVLAEDQALTRFPLWFLLCPCSPCSTCPSSGGWSSTTVCPSESWRSARVIP